MQNIESIDEAIEVLYGLNVGVIGRATERHERPHKPALLLAVLDLLATGRAQPQRIPWSQDLRQRFTTYFETVRRKNDQNSPENPFYHLSGDDFWNPLEIVNGKPRPLGATPTVAQAEAGSVFAQFKGGMGRFVTDPARRTRLRQALVSRFFPTLQSRLQTLFAEPSKTAAVAEETERCREDAEIPPPPGRDGAFRRIVLEAYDFQCAACGLRIKLPDADVTFVDGAHLIPFAHSRNDHPTNGIALCKNHHWAMDRALIAPTTDRIWKASKRLIGRRSPGEAALVALDGQPLLPPHDDAFLPAVEGLAWRTDRLYGKVVTPTNR